ncbi:MAG: AAA family ATPase [Nitrospirae bacterium]|nr:AAA family ATPase [Magnetococcales bacterium]HAT50726.1 hypothetical protein [Alphaproteobacteria bacterium]
MKTYSFFSFKGGVGRTALMVNIGAYWANRGETVLMIDMDLSAPGLSYSPLLGDYLHAEGQGKGFSDLLAVFYQVWNKNPNQLHFMPPHLYDAGSLSARQEWHTPEGETLGDGWASSGRGCRNRTNSATRKVSRNTHKRCLCPFR